MNQKFDNFIKFAGFSSTFEHDRLYKLIELVIVECGNEIDRSDFMNYKYPGTTASILLAKIFKLQNEQNQN